MKNYHFTFKQSGKDVKGNLIKDTASYSMNIEASSETVARKKLRSNFYKSVIITITATTISQA